MSAVQSSAPERGPSPSLNPNLSSNNPFRNRAASPASLQSLPSPQSPNFNNRPVSRNPFLDVFDNDTEITFPQPPTSSNKPMSYPADVKTGTIGSTVEAFDNLAIEQKSVRNGAQSGPNADGVNGRSARQENVPPPPYPGDRIRAPTGHRPSRSQEEEARTRNGGAHISRSGRPSRPKDVFADPDPNRRRLRRNSDTSIAEIQSSLKPEMDDRRRDRRKRDEARRDGRPSSSSKPRKPNQRLDIIDKLDVTSIYGTGLFHHDGPFDACNPHRNRRKDNRAPMQAFPKDSANNAIGGSGPVNKTFDPSQFMGRNNTEAFTDYSTSSRDRPGYETYDRPEKALPIGAFSATARVDPVHGDESLGLGTSTFLEGAPASRTAIQRRESETEGQNLQQGGLQRKKSLAQKIRGMGSVRQPNPNGRMTSPEPSYEVGSAITTSPRSQSVSAGGPAKMNERNPFFNEYDAAYDRKGEMIASAQEEKLSVVPRNRRPSSPKKGPPLAYDRSAPALERRITTDNPPLDGGAKPAGGFMSRVKSLKGGRKPRQAAEA